MSNRNIYITQSDVQRLEQLLATSFVIASVPKQVLASLHAELKRAHIVADEEMPQDVVTMHSIVRLRDLESNEEEVYTLVYPGEANIAMQKLSILAPIGTAILGYGVGDVVSWPVPGGMRELVVEEVISQPEREKNMAVGSPTI